MTIFHFSHLSLREAIFILLHQIFLHSSFFYPAAPQGRLYGLMRRAKEKALRWQRGRLGRERMGEAVEEVLRVVVKKFFAFSSSGA